MVTGWSVRLRIRGSSTSGCGMRGKFIAPAWHLVKHTVICIKSFSCTKKQAFQKLVLQETLCAKIGTASFREQASGGRIRISRCECFVF
jgi:hypothetical protein